MSEETVYKAEEINKLKENRSALPALAIIATGLVLLAAQLFNFHLMEIFWPLLIVGPGLLLMLPAYNATPERQSSFWFLAIPGAVFTAIGGLLFVMNLTGHFEAWAYSWPLLAAAAAGGWMYAKRYDETSSAQRRGYKFIRWMAMLFGGLAIFFEILVFENLNPLLSLALVGFGFYLLLRDRRETTQA